MATPPLPPLQYLRLEKGAQTPSPIDLPPDLVDLLVEHAIDSSQPCASVIKLCDTHPYWAGLCRDGRIFDAANRALGWYGEQKTWPKILEFYEKNYPNLQMLNTSGQTQTPKAYFEWVCGTSLRRVDNVGQENPWFAARLLQWVQSKPSSDWPYFKDIRSRILPTYTEIAKLYVAVLTYKLGDVPPSHRDFYQIALVALAHNPNVLRMVSPDRNDFGKLAKYAVQQPTRPNDALLWVNSDREDYTEIALLAMQQDGMLLGILPRDHADYFEIAKAAIDQTEGAALGFVHGAGIPPLPLFFELATYAIGKYGWPIGVVLPGPAGSTLRAEYVRLAKLALEVAPQALIVLDQSIEEYRELAIQAIRKDWMAINAVPSTHKDFTKLRAIADRVRVLGTYSDTDTDWDSD